MKLGSDFEPCIGRSILPLMTPAHAMFVSRPSLMALRGGAILAQVKADRAAKLTEQLLAQTP